MRWLKFSNLLFVCFCSLSLIAAVSPSLKNADNTEPLPDVPPTVFADIAPILAANCQFCHSTEDPSGGVALETEVQVQGNIKRILDAVSTGFMPYGDPEWRFTEDGKKLIAWLQTQVPAEEPAPQ